MIADFAVQTIPAAIRGRCPLDAAPAMSTEQAVNASTARPTMVRCLGTLTSHHVSPRVRTAAAVELTLREGI